MGKKLRVASMFAGIGGICLGFKQAGYSIVWANEIDKHACRTYRANFGDKYLVEGDIQTIDPDTIPDIDVLTAGFPCQSFSSVGLQEGLADPRGNLFFETTRVIAQKKPKIVFLENVANLVKHDDGKTFNIIYSSLASLGYSVRYNMMNASDYGYPQQRNRIYIVAFREDSWCNAFQFPEQVKLKHNAFYYFDKEKQPDSYYMDGHKKWDEMITYMNDKKRIYRFTDWGLSRGREGICPTLLAAMGSPYERIPFFFDSFSIRKITQRECARLQGFPDSFILPLDKAPKQVYKQLGNTVVVPIIKSIAKNILSSMENDTNE